MNGNALIENRIKRRLEGYFSDLVHTLKELEFENLTYRLIYK